MILKRPDICDLIHVHIYKFEMHIIANIKENKLVKA